MCNFANGMRYMSKKNKEIEINEPRMVKSHDVKLDTEYAEWIAEVKHRYRSAQVKATVKVNGEKLLFNWQMGRDLVQKKAEERWGAGVVEQVSLDLKREFPNEDGFSTSNLWYMKKWYLFYTNHKLQRLIGELQSSINQERLKLQRPVGELVKQPVSENWNDASNDFPIPFALVPWGQHIEIITRSESLEEALFYMQHVIEKGLSRTALVNCYKAHLYDHQGKIVNNFSTYLPEPQSHLVQEVLKENYDFGFATVDHERIGRCPYQRCYEPFIGNGNWLCFHGQTERNHRRRSLTEDRLAVLSCPPSLLYSVRDQS